MIEQLKQHGIIGYPFHLLAQKKYLKALLFITAIGVLAYVTFGLFLAALLLSMIFGRR